jgi:hypothetical protein
MQAIDRCAPAAVTLRYGPLVVGTIPVQPWSEPLAGRHLRLLLRTRFPERFAQTLELAHTVDLPSMRPLDELVTPSMDRASSAYQQHHS